MYRNRAISGFDFMPKLVEGYWARVKGKVYNEKDLAEIFGIDVTKFPLINKTPIKIRAVWEQVHETI